MKKTFKRLGAMFLAMVMAVSVLCTGAFAANTAKTGPFTITIKNSSDNYEYEAYQIFSGDLALDEKENKILSNIAWGSGVDSETTKETSDEDKTIAGKDLMGAIQAITLSDNSQPFSSCKTVADVVGVLSKITDKDNTTTQAFAKVVGKYTTTTKTGSQRATTGDSHYADGAHYDITVQKAGYYLVKNTKIASATEGNSDNTFSSYILEVVGDVNVEPKVGVPTVEKKIVEDSTDKDSTTVGVNDTVTFKLTGTLPSNYADYDSYKYVFHDTLSSGLTLDESSIEVKVYKDGNTGNTNDTNCVKLEKGTSDGNYSVLTRTSVSENDTDKENCTFEVKIDDLKKIEGLDEKSIIVVTYKATLNSGAVTSGNDNTVHLEYSNNPNGEGTGNTKDEKVTVYTLQLDVVKVDGASKDTENNTYETALAGAKFILSTDSNLQKDLTDTNIDTDGNLTANNSLANSLIAVKVNDASPNYVVDDSTATETKTYVMEVCGTDGENKGKLNIQGLKPNQTYYLYETKAPNGYNKLTAPVEIKIDKDGKVTGLATTDHKIQTLYVENNAGSNLPSTGGMGTKLFYTVGGLLMAGAAIVLVIKKRRSTAE